MENVEENASSTCSCLPMTKSESGFIIGKDRRAPEGKLIHHYRGKKSAIFQELSIKI